MPDNSWSTETIIFFFIVAVVFAAIGFVIGRLMQLRKSEQLSAQFEQSQLELQKAVADLSDSRSQLKTAETLNHQQQLTESKLSEQLNAARATESRLSTELSEHKNELASQGKRLDEANQKHHSAEKLHETALADIRSLNKELAEYRDRLKNAEASLNASLVDVNRLRDNLAAEEKEHAKLKTSLEKREEHFKEQMAQLAETRQSLTKEFENVANKIFEEKGKTFTDTSKNSIDNLLKPFREQIEGFQKRVNEIHDLSNKGNSDLGAEIKKVLEIGLKMNEEASNLASALKGDSQQRGAWGEAQLQQTLEMSGLVKDYHYETQTPFKDADGNSKKTDYLIKLPDNKRIIIDSKVSLVAYDRAVSAQTPEEYQLAMAEHIKAVRKHIDDLASKDYTNLIGMRSPSFVLMFMAIEPAYIEALKNNKDLFEYGYKKGIVLVSHTTLIPILRTVSNLWMIERSNAEAREISERAGDIFNQVCVVAERMKRLGGTLKTASNQYNEAITGLAGQQGLYGKVERFTKLSEKVSKSLPHIEPVHMDFETEKLALIVEPIDEPEQAIAVLPEPAEPLEAATDETA